MPTLTPTLSPNLLQLPSLTNVVAIIGLSFIGYIGYSIIYNLYFHPLRHIPAVTTLASITPAWKYIRLLIYGDRFHVLHEALTTRSPVIRQGPDDIILADPKWTKKVLLGKLGREKIFERTTLHGAKNLISSSDYQPGILKRKYISPQFSNTNLMAFEGVMLKHTHGGVGFLRDRKGQATEVMSLISHLIIDIVGEILLDGDIQCMETLAKGKNHAVVDSMSVLAYAFNADRVIPKWLMKASLIFIRNPGWVNTVNSMDVVTDTVHSFAASALKRGAHEDRLALVHRLDRDAEKYEKRPLTVEEMVSELGLQFFAGMETTAIALTYCYWLLAKNPDILQKLFIEVSQADTESTNGLDIPTVMRLQYLNAVIKETLRLYPPAPTARTKIVNEEGMQIDEYYLPPGTAVGLQIWTMHRSKEIWGVDADEFRPERWLGEMTEEQNSAWQPFSMGGRNCVGMNLANVDMRLITAHFARNFDFKCDSRTTEETMRTIDTESLKPASGQCWLQFIPRSE